MQKFSLEINKTIKKKDVMQKQKCDNTFNSTISRSTSLPNNSEINFKKDHIDHLSNLKKSCSDDNNTFPTNLLPSDKYIEYIPESEENTYISTEIINQTINPVNNPDIMSLTGVPPDPDNY